MMEAFLVAFEKRKDEVKAIIGPHVVEKLRLMKQVESLQEENRMLRQAIAEAHRKMQALSRQNA